MLFRSVVVECLIEPCAGMGGEPQAVALAPQGEEGGVFRFALSLSPANAGLQEMRLRVYPWHPLLAHRFEMGLMRWV